MKETKFLHFRRSLALVLAAALSAGILSGCSVYSSITRLDKNAARDEGETDVTEQGSEEVELQDTEESAPFEDQIFTLNYHYSEPLNPYTCSNRFNLAAGQLVYESLYNYDADFVPHPVLAEEATTEDAKVWKVRLKKGVHFHDGTELKASDVVYSLRQSASASGTYNGRFSYYFCIDITANDDYNLTFTLAYPDWDFLRMLDVPIIRTGDADKQNPTGTGPYQMGTIINPDTGEGTLYLGVYAGHRDAANMPIDRIYLREYNDGNLSSAFSDGYIDLLEFDPTGVEAVSVQMDHETRYYNTTILQYLGFNYKNYALSDARIRQAIGHVVNYSIIVDDILKGKALASPLILSPALDCYDSAWEKELGAGYDLVAFSQAFQEFGMVDEDDDGYLEYPHNGWTDMKLTLLVNNDNSSKIAVAERIASSLRSVGVEVVVEQASFANYIYRLNHGDFDLYIAEVRLPADFDPSQLFVKYGLSNYGGVTERSGMEGVYTQLIREYLGASPYATVTTASSGSGSSGSGSGSSGEGVPTPNGGEGPRTATETVTDLSKRSQAALELCKYVYNNAPVIPICYKRYCVISHRNVIYNLQPSKSNIFRNLTEVTIDLGVVPETVTGALLPDNDKQEEDGERTSP